MFKGINDSDNHIYEISKLFDKNIFKIKVSNYIPINGSNIIPAKTNDINLFLNKLKEKGFYAVHRNNVGVQIGGACGHLISTK